MSYQIKDSTISLTRGDTLKAKVKIIKKDGSEYLPTPGDNIRFALKENYSDDEEVLIYKTIPHDKMILFLEPEDTKKLKMRKIYVYDIQITMEDGTVDTFLNGKLKVLEEVE